MYEYKILEICKVVDGDTVDMILDLGFSLRLKQRIRLAEIDAPEILSKDDEERRLGFVAKAYVEEWLKSSDSLRVRTVKGDKYGHMLGYVFNDKSQLNTDLVELGYAWKYDGGTKSKDFSKISGWSGHASNDASTMM